MIDFKKTYDPGEFEEQILKLWHDNNCFHADVNSKKEPFSVVLPPPNITGKLHMGHALNITLQDIIVRFKRMKGFEVLWLPGSDHAAIATEAKIVESLKKQGISKNELGRERFLEKAWSWKENFETEIFNQIEKLGASCDFERKRFTMDEGCSEAVNEFFVRLFKEGLIYKGERVINWCFKCKTSISDAEVEHEEHQGFFWHLKYFFADDKTKFIEIATTRPETLFGDVAVAVNPNDSRYTNLIGRKVIVPLINREIPIIADDYVDMEFGTGAVKITPAHDFNDFEVGMRHKLKPIRVIDFDGKLNEETGQFNGTKLGEARKLVVDELTKQNLIEKIVDHLHNVGCCYRCGSVVEPIISKQWFVKMDELAKPAIDVVNDKILEFIPPHFAKTYLNWLYSIKDWCISRQLWWGHRIPAWYCDKCGNIIIQKTTPTVCDKCGSNLLEQDSDTLDTWFSSALWPFATMGWPNEDAADYCKFYPTNILVTGYDIIFFWVVRMVFAGLKNTKKAPFSKVLIHGIVRDSQGRKMSKSLGNGINPLDVIDEVGADALRFVLASNINAGSDIRWSDDKILAARNFVNKLWNASRFIFLNVEKVEGAKLNCIPTELEIEDIWLLSKLKVLVDDVAHNIENFEISVASQKLYDFVWDIFCSWFVEIAKIRFSADLKVAQNAISILTYALGVILKLLHPIMPFITEKINMLMFKDESEILATSNWPQLNLDLNFEEGLQFEKIVEAIKKIRRVRTDMKIENGKKTKILIETDFTDLFKKSSKFFQFLAFASDVEVSNKIEDILGDNFVKLVTDSARIFIDISNLVDVGKERERLLKEKQNCEGEIEFYKNKLADEQFLAKAPAAVREKQQDKLNAAISRLEKVVLSLKELESK